MVPSETETTALKGRRSRRRRGVGAGHLGRELVELYHGSGPRLHPPSPGSIHRILHMAHKPASKTVHRSSESGKFVTERYADRHPRTTETERIKKTGRK